MRWIRFTALLVALFVVGCSSAVVGRVGEKEITRADIDKRMAIFKLFSPDFDAGAVDKADIVDQLLDEQIVALEADAKKIKLEDDDIETAMEELETALETQFGDEKKVASALRKFGLTKDDLKEVIINSLITQQLFNQVIADVEVTPEEVEGYYQDHPDKFQLPEQIKASHILVDEEELAHELRGRIEEGEDFAQLAKQFSTDPGSGENGGDLGYFSPGQMVPEFDQAAFATAEGDISPVTKTDFGYHIIKVEDKKPPTTLELEEVESFLTAELKNQKCTEKFETYFQEAKNKHQPDNKLALKETD
ncbi:MAG TPA: peptidylprolyl isomerase [bacterium]|jgi:foldase protein PrsA|nr:peptidylprolyl isomerase [bacterium]